MDWPLLWAQQPLVLREPLVAATYAPQYTRAHLGPFPVNFLGDTQTPVGGMLGAMGEGGLLDLLTQTIRVSALDAGGPFQGALDASGLKVPADFAEWLPGIAHHLNGLADVVTLHGRRVTG